MDFQCLLFFIKFILQSFFCIVIFAASHSRYQATRKPNNNFAATAPIRLRAIINTEKAYVEFLVATDGHREITIASSGYNRKIEKLIDKILLSTNGACIKEEG